jgi:hypothetical protein
LHNPIPGIDGGNRNSYGLKIKIKMKEIEKLSVWHTP